MWQQSRQTLILTQIFIIGACALLYLSGRMTLPATLVVFIVMQVGGVLGAVFGARLKEKREHRQSRLPLDRK